MDTSETAAILYYIVVVGLAYGAVLYMAACELAACFRRWRSRAAAERLLDTVPDPDVPYLPLPDDDEQAAAAAGSGGGGPSSWSSSPSCVICMAEYERGEGRFVLPVCGHAFHRACIAEWLRKGTSIACCPVCRTTAVVVGAGPVAGDGEGDVAAAGVSAAEDMV